LDKETKMGRKTNTNGTEPDEPATPCGDEQSGGRDGHGTTRRIR
jgi:hypothetical protein